MNSAFIPAAVQRAIEAVISAPVMEDDAIDYGFAEGDDTSVWIVREGEKPFV
jgi:hypothetical protein